MPRILILLINATHLHQLCPNIYDMGSEPTGPAVLGAPEVYSWS